VHCLYIRPFLLIQTAGLNFLFILLVLVVIAGFLSRPLERDPSRSQLSPFSVRIHVSWSSRDCATDTLPCTSLSTSFAFQTFCTVLGGFSIGGLGSLLLSGLKGERFFILWNPEGSDSRWIRKQR
jgi:hypothetical protein